LIEQDTPLDEALRIAGRATGNSNLRIAAGSLAERISSGDTSHLPHSRSFPPLVTLALRNADNKPLMLSTLAQAESLYRQRAITTAQYAAEYLPVLLVAGVGGLSVAALAAVVFWPYLSMLETLSRPFWN
jgi:type II secretory pathway component PulF